MSESDPPPGEMKFLVIGAALLTKVMAVFWCGGVVFATAIGSKSPPGEMYLLLFSPMIVAIGCIVASIFFFGSDQSGASALCALLGLASMPIGFALGMVFMGG